LIFLLVANGSQALEIVTHDSHGHGEIVAMDIGDTPEARSAHSHNLNQVSGEYSQVQNDECFCDDICCFSSIGFVTPLTAGANPHAASVSETLPEHYQSVSLDLLLPPPTRSSH
jgi:hypothetical protein